MKKIILLLLLPTIILGVKAQNASNQKYYAIDGSIWYTSTERDLKEQILWDRVELHLRTALAANRLGIEKGKERHDTLKKLFEQCRRAIAEIRAADAGKSVMQNPEFRAFLRKNYMDIVIAEGTNGERFNFEEYADCFNSALREYSFNSKLVEEMANIDGKEYNLDFVITDFKERMQLVQVQIKQEKRVVSAKEKTIKIFLGQYISEKKEALKQRQQKELFNLQR